MPQSETSVADSISYLRDFLDTSDAAAAHSRAAAPRAPLASSHHPSRPVPFTHLGNTFSKGGPAGTAATVPSLRSTPSSISALSPRSSAQVSVVDETRERATTTGKSSVLFTSGRAVLQRDASRSHAPLNTTTPRDPSQPYTVGAAPPTATAAVSFLGPNLYPQLEHSYSQDPQPTPRTPHMFRYGKDSASRGSGDNWWRSSLTVRRSDPADAGASFSHSFYPNGAVERGHTATWPALSPPSQDRPSQPPPSRASSSPSVFPRAIPASHAPEPFTWRRSSLPPATHHGSSLLWGWGDAQVGGAATYTPTQAAAAAAAAPSPSPLQSSFFSSGDRHDLSGNRASHHPDDVFPHGPSVTRASREAAYEEVIAPADRPAGAPPRPAPSPPRSASAPQLPQHAARPPLPPLPASASTTPLAISGSDDLSLTPCHNPAKHAAHMRRIAHYLKGYYAREADEVERGVESLSAEDVAGLAQCFYIDLYRTIRQARRAAGVETSSFVAEDPTENVIAAVAPAAATASSPSLKTPPRPHQERDRYAHPSHVEAANHGSHPTPSHAYGGEDVRGSDATDGDVSEEIEVDLPPSTPPPPPQSRASPSVRSTPPTHHQAASPGPSRGRTSFVPAASSPAPSQNRSAAKSASRSLTRGDDDTSSPTNSEYEEEFPGGSNSRSAKAATRRAANAQLAFSGGGTHPVQVITARVPAFRNEDSVREGRKGAAVPQKLRTQGGGKRMPPQQRHQQSSLSHTNFTEGLPRRSVSDRDTEASSSLALAASPSPPYRHLSPAATPPHPTPKYQTFPSLSPPHAAQGNASLMQQSILQHPPSVSRTNTLSEIHSNASSPREERRQRATRPKGGRHVQMAASFIDDSSSDSDSGSDIVEAGGKGHHRSSSSSFTAEGSNTGGDARSLSGTVAKPSSGIVKHPLRELMPLLRARGTVMVKQIRHGRRPHLRIFQVLDCTDTYKGQEVLMPHLTWAAAEGIHRHAAQPKAKKTKGSVVLPRGLSLSQHEVPYETALNLIHLEAVYVGAGRGISETYLRLFHRRAKDGAVLDHRHRPVAPEMCAVFVFASRPLALTFLREEDRQLWVGAMMGVVERNRTLNP